MSKDVEDILRALDEYDSEEASVGLELRLSLAEIVRGQLGRMGWSQRDLAERTGLRESYISRVLHSNANCTLGTAGKFLFALGIRARLQEAAHTSACTFTGYGNSGFPRLRLTQGQTDGEEIPQTSATTENAEISIRASA